MSTYLFPGTYTQVKGDFFESKIVEFLTSLLATSCVNISGSRDKAQMRAVTIDKITTLV